MNVDIRLYIEVSGCDCVEMAHYMLEDDRLPPGGRVVPLLFSSNFSFLKTIYLTLDLSHPQDSNQYLWMVDVL